MSWRPPTLRLGYVSTTNNLREHATDPDRGSPAVMVRRLSKTYARTVAVDDVSFDVGRGEIFGILGPNGAGKTTTVELLTGLRRPDSGSVDVLGLDPWTDRTAFTEAVGVQLQSSRLPEKIRVGEAVELYGSFYRDPVDGGELLDRLGLAGSSRIRYGALSGGQQQRLAVALALIGRPRVAVLDELTTGLDPQARRETWGLIAGIRNRGATVVLVTHFMEEAEYLCDRLIVIDRGRVIAEGSPGQIVGATSGTSQVTFRPSAPFADTLLTDLAAVTSMTRSEDRVTVRGGEDMLQAVASTLSNAGIVTGGLRVHQTSLEDAFVALVGEPDEETIAADAPRRRDQP
jgi:ABC-2 type transport system ATP-binding protein